MPIPSDAPFPETVQAFLDATLLRARELGVQIRIYPGASAPYLDNEEMRVSGYFSGDERGLTPTLAVATGKPLEEWLPIFAHESSHMDQWAEKDPSWTGNTMPDGRDAVDWIDEWCTGERPMEPAQLADAIERATAVEMDCERRTLEKIAHFGLPIDAKEYAQKSNAYVHFYAHIADFKQWYPPGQAPYQVEAVWTQAATEITSVANPELKQAFAQAYPPASPVKGLRP